MIRLVNPNDNLNKVARLIYDTDPYIYPFWFSNKPAKAVQILKRLILTKNNLFYYKNISGLFVGKKLLGIVVCFNGKTNLTYDYEREMMDKNSRTTIKEYLLKLNEEQREDETYISNICIDKKYRGQGFGKLLLANYLKKNKCKKYSLHVLADNKVAKHLYHSVGFTRTKTEFGFSGYKNAPVKTYEMKMSK